MRTAFFVLLLANLLLFIWGQGYLGMPEAGREPDRVSRQVEPEKLRIVRDAAAMEEKKPVVACQRIEGLSAEEAKSLTDAVHIRSGWETQTLPVTSPPWHWVAIADLPSSTAAEKKKAELNQLGIRDSEIVAGTTANTFAVSLGLFREAERAQEYLQKLTGKGVRSARIVPRDVERFAVEMRAPNDQLATTLPGLAAALPHTTTQDCAAP